MKNILSQIVEDVEKRLPGAKSRRPEALLREKIAALPPPPGFAEAFSRREGARYRIIAELKAASPSRGVIRNDLDVRALARELADAGAAALSILTETTHFHGSLENLRIAAENVEIPLLRKDFIIDAYQLLEARADGASAVLLIAALFPGAGAEKLRFLVDEAHRLGLDVLGEAHEENEIALLADAGCDCIGVNARDLKTFQTSLDRVERLLPLVPEGRVAIAESAISSTADLERLAEAGADGFLVGEALMREASPGAALCCLLGCGGGSAGK